MARERWEKKERDIAPLLRRMADNLNNRPDKKVIYLSVVEWDDYVNNSKYVAWDGKIWFTYQEVRVEEKV